MIKANLREQIINLLAYVLFQIWFNNKIVLFDQAFAFFYIGYLLLLPGSVGRPLQLIIGFFVGLLIDIFHNTPGLNAGACVLLAFARNPWLKVTLGNENELASLNLYNFGFTRFLYYIFPLTLLHHIFLFIVEHGGLHHTILLGSKIFISSIFSTVVILVFNYLTALRKKE